MENLLIKQVETLFKRLLTDLAAYDRQEMTSAGKLAGKSHIIQEALGSLRSLLDAHAFKDEQEEIDFFKNHKPRFVSERILAFEKFTIETNIPRGDDGALANFYEQEMKVLKRFFGQYQFMYQYYILGASDLDHLLFLRNAVPSGILMPEIPAEEPEFSTAADYLFAKFMAYERLQDDLMDSLYGKAGRSPGFLTKKGRKLQWTGDKTNLVELAYGIYDTKQLNNGDIEITDIISWLETTLEVDAGRFYQVFADIKARKSVSRTRYLDHMRVMLLKHIEEGDAFIPAKPQNVSGSRDSL